MSLAQRTATRKAKARARASQSPSLRLNRAQMSLTAQMTLAMSGTSACWRPRSVDGRNSHMQVV